MPSYRIADAQRPLSTTPRHASVRAVGPDPEERRRQRERVIASLLAVPGRGDRVGSQRAA